MRTHKLRGPKFGALLLCGLLSVVAHAESPRLDAEPNQLISFKKILIEPVQDNLDGAFKATFEQAYRDVFERNPRFEVVSEASQADSSVFTTIEKKATSIDVEIKLKLAPSGEIFTTEKMQLPSLASQGELTTGAKRVLKTLLKRIPFYGTVSGREGDELTFDIGSSNGLRENDTVQIARVDHIRRHPLLKSILDVEMVPVGTAEVTNVEGTIAFAHVKQEIPGEKIQRMHKVVAIESRPETQKNLMDPGLESFEAERGSMRESYEPKPEIGFVSIGPFLGGFSSAGSRNNGAMILSGSGFNPGFQLDGELWLTKNWFADAAFGYGVSSMQFIEEHTQAKSGSFDTTTARYDFDIGYRHFVWNTTKGPFVNVKMGYGKFSWGAPVEDSQLLGPRKYSFLRLGFGGGIPFKRADGLFTMGIAFGLFPAYSSPGFSLSPDITQSPSPSVAEFNVGYSAHIYSNFAVRGEFMFSIYSVEFTGGLNGFGTSNSSQKQIGFLPSLLYYF